MMRTTSLLLALGLVVAACGTAATGVGGESPQSAGTEATQETTSSTPQPSTQGTQGTVAPSATTATTDAAEAPAPVAEGPPAPNFTLTLSDGSTYELASAERPVMLVFWAEW